MTTRAQIVLAAVLRILRPLVRWLVRNGVRHQELTAGLKPVFLEVARAELLAGGRAATDSAVSLLSGVHRRDVRQLTRAEPAVTEGPPRPAGGVIGEAVGRWMSEPEWLDAEGHPRVLPRNGDQGFDGLVGAISRDVRPRAVLEEMVRLGVVEEADGGVRLRTDGFAPRSGLDDMAALASWNLHDHAAAAVANLEGDANFLEQALYVDELTVEGQERVRQAVQQAWRQAVRTVMREARATYEHDQAHAAPEQRTQRARFGVYFFSQRSDES